jgi:hypothetical protein
MKQLFIALITLIYSFASSFIILKLNYNKIIFSFLALFMTSFYLLMMYYLNNGIITLYLKLNIIVGIYVCIRCVKFNKKM